jgi:hypothetical protein
LIKKHNQVRAEASRKEEKLIVLQKELYTVGLEEHVLKSNQEGTGPDAARLRELENKLDKAKIKRHEANHIGKTYKKIIQRLMDDRLEFDNKLVELEQTLSRWVGQIPGFLARSVCCRGNRVVCLWVCGSTWVVYMAF